MATLYNESLLDLNDLKLYRPHEWDVEGDPWDLITGVLAEFMDTTGSLMMGVSDLPKGAVRAMRFKSSGNGDKKAGTYDVVWQPFCSWQRQVIC